MSKDGVETDLGDGVTAKWYIGSGHKKYKVKLYRDGEFWKTVSFGDDRYQQYQDQTPIKYYANKDHLDESRRANYRSRHGAQGYQERKYSPAWFSWNYLW